MSNGFKRRCYVYDKTGCFSTNHTIEEWKAARERFNNDRISRGIRYNNRKFAAFLTDYEGDETCDEGTEAFYADNDDEEEEGDDLDNQAEEQFFAAGPDGLVPTLLAFGAYPRITADSPPSGTSVQRAKASAKAMTELRKMMAAKTCQ